MTIQSRRAQQASAPAGSVEFDADVLVLGGGPAGTWAAISAAEQGARVVLADKGFCGTSGATAAAGTGVWYVNPDPALREAAMANREKLGGHLQDRRWMARVLDRTFEQTNWLAEWGYPYPVDDGGRSQRNSLQGPGFAELDLRWSHDCLLGKAKKDGPRVTFALDAFNVTNSVNFAGYIGNLSSPFFGQPVAAKPPRRLQASARLSF